MRSDEIKSTRLRAASKACGIAAAAILQGAVFLLMRGNVALMQTTIGFTVGTVLAAYVTLREVTLKETVALAATGWIGSFLVTVGLPIGYFAEHPAAERVVVAVMQASIGFPMIALTNFMGATIAEKLLFRKGHGRNDA